MNDDSDDFPSQASLASDQEGCCSPHHECAPAQSHTSFLGALFQKFVKLIKR